MIYDFTGRFQAAFGYVPGSALGLVIDKKFPISASTYQFADGKFEDVRLYRSNTDDYQFAYKNLSEEYNDILATPPMLSLKRGKKLVITPIDNTDFEVIERYGTEPYDITWRGLLIDMVDHQFPIDKMEKLNEIFEYNGEWNVASEILNKVGVMAVYVRDITFEFVEGFEDTISYIMSLRAIKPLEYQIND